MTPEAILDGGQRILAFGVAFGILVFVHELGHYVVAKLCGVTVEVFSFGFGKRLFGFSRKGTDYRVSLVPLGGYVKMLGESPDETLVGDAGEFGSKPKWQRLLVLVAGAAMNIVLAVLCYTAVFTQGDVRHLFLDEPPVVGGLSEGQPAEKSGLLPGDLIRAVNGRAVATWDEFILLELLNPDKPVTLNVEREGALRDIVVHATSHRETITNSKIGSMGIEPRGALRAFDVDPALPAGQAGLKDGDRIVSVDGTAIEDRATLIRIIRGSAGRPIPFVLDREGASIPIVVAARQIQGMWRTGFRPDYETRHVDFNVAQAFVRALEEAWSQADFTYYTLKSLFTRQVALSAVSGPIGIFQFTGKAAESGWESYVRVIGLISLQLGIINLLPIPVLDGGHIFILLIEGVIRRDLSFRIKERLVSVGFVFLVALMVVVIFNDISKNVPGGLEKFLPWGGP